MASKSQLLNNVTLTIDVAWLPKMDIIHEFGSLGPHTLNSKFIFI